MMDKRLSKVPVCSICNEDTNDPVYIGKLRCKCGMKMAIGRCCKPALLEQFASVRECVTFMAKMHVIQCKKHREREERARKEILVDLSDEYVPCDCPREMN